MIKIADRFELWDVADLVPYERNTRAHEDEQIDQIAASIAEFGFIAPIIFDARRGRIAAGHGRLLAAKKLGLARVPVIRVEHLTDAQFRAYSIADNKLTDNSRFDQDLLVAELTDLRDEGFDLTPIGFTDAELSELLPDLDEEPAAPAVADDDAVPDVLPEPVSRLGDIWRLGQHRVMCGDSTSGEALAGLLEGQPAACLWTDPPYNVNYQGSAGTILNDNMSDHEFAQFLRAVFRNAAAHMADGAPAYIAHADAGPMGVAFRQEFMRAGFHLASCLIWRKNTFTLGRSDYHWQHEPILYGWKQGAAHRWYGERDKATVLELVGSVITRTADDELQINMGETALVIRGQGLTVGRVHGSVFLEEKPKRNSEHPTMKPVALIERMLENSTQPGDIVLDLFGGSGSTLIACEKSKRHARMMELDPRFADVEVRRWQEFTGRTARLAETGETFAEVKARRAAGGRMKPAAPQVAAIMTAGLPFTGAPAANDADGAERRRA